MKSLAEPSLGASYRERSTLRTTTEGGWSDEQEAQKEAAQTLPWWNYKPPSHILWQRRYWNNGYLKALREHEYLVVETPVRTLHRQIHNSMTGIPIIRQNSARSALNELDRLYKLGVISQADPISKRIELLIALLDCVEPAAVKALKRQLAIVVIYEERLSMMKPCWKKPPIWGLFSFNIFCKYYDSSTENWFIYSRWICFWRSIV